MPVIDEDNSDEEDTSTRHAMIIQDINSDEDSVPIPESVVAAICHGEQSLDNFSKMRVFNTLFSENGISTDLKGQFWKKLV